MKIIARNNGRHALPPIGKYIGTPPPAKSFEQHEIPKINIKNIQLRPDGVRQPTVEARILGNMVAIAQGRTCKNLDVLSRG